MELCAVVCASHLSDKFNIVNVMKQHVLNTAATTKQTLQLHFPRLLINDRNPSLAEAMDEVRIS